MQLIPRYLEKYDMAVIDGVTLKGSCIVIPELLHLNTSMLTTWE